MFVGLLGASGLGRAHDEPLLTGTGPAEAVEVRELWLNLDAVGGEGERRLRYDLAAVTAPLSVEAYAQQPAWVVAARLVLAEVGPDRLVHGEHGLDEAMGVLLTVRNRMDPAASNPEGIVGLRAWPGCGMGATFQSCANPQQYHGLNQRWARSPGTAIADPELRALAIDRAVAAWWLVFRGEVADLTEGGTSFVHRCGGRAYGKPVSYCDGNPEVPDVPGARRYDGPIEFRGPTVYESSRGRYRQELTARIDFAAFDGVAGGDVLLTPAPSGDGVARAPREEAAPVP